MVKRADIPVCLERCKTEAAGRKPQDGSRRTEDAGRKTQDGRRRTGRNACPPDPSPAGPGVFPRRDPAPAGPEVFLRGADIPVCHWGPRGRGRTGRNACPPDPAPAQRFFPGGDPAPAGSGAFPRGGFACSAPAARTRAGFGLPRAVARCRDADRRPGTGRAGQADCECEPRRDEWPQGLATVSRETSRADPGPFRPARGARGEGREGRIRGGGTRGGLRIGGAGAYNRWAGRDHGDRGRRAFAG